MKPIAMLTRAELSRRIAVAVEIPLRRAELLLETVIESMVSALRRGEEIEIRRFGAFRLHRRGPRKGRNPATGAAVEVPARTIVVFRLSKELVRLLDTAPEGGSRSEDALESSPAPPDKAQEGSSDGSEPYGGDDEEPSRARYRRDKVCCGPWAAQRMRLAATTGKIAHMRADPMASPTEFDRLVRKKAKIESWLMAHSH